MARRPTICDAIADELKLRILAGEWTLGQALPSNKHLAEEFDTSTLTVREAVAQLIAAGFLESRHGSGTYVVDVDPAARENAEGFIAADFEFHQLVAEAAHNRILPRAMLAMRGPLRRLMSERAVEDLHDHGNLDTPIADHFAVVDALEQRDVEVAVGALSNMIRRNQDHLRRTSS